MKFLQIAIPEPCHENWQNMTPSDQGRFCNACAKTVVDFSMMSDHEVLSYFSTASDEKICGRTLSTQLHREIKMPRQPKKKLFWYWNYIAMFFMFFSKSNQVKAQGRVVQKTEQKPTCGRVTMGLLAPLLKTDRLISGKVIDGDGRPVVGATVRIVGAPIGTITDANGEYQIGVKNNCILEFSSVGYQVLRQLVDEKTTTLNATVVVLHEMMVGEIVVMTRRNVDSDDYTGVNTQPNQVFEIKVKDKETLTPVGDASITITGHWGTEPETRSTDKYGVYKIKKVKDNDFYRVTVIAYGYEKNEITIQGSRADARKIIKEVYLVKKQPAIIMGGMISGLQINQPKKSDTSTKAVGLHCNRSIPGRNQPLLVVDDVEMPITYIGTLNPKDVLSVNILKGATASALYGSDAAEYGVIIVATKQKKQSDSLRVVKDIVKKVADKIGITSNTNTINLYPNPVRSGSSFVVDLGLQRMGEMEIQITDLNGRVVLQKQITSSSKDHLEKIETDERWPAGMYFLNLFNSNGGQQGKLINAVSFVVQ